MDIATRALSHVDVIPAVRDGEVSWKPDSSGFVYNWLPFAADIKEADLYKYCEIRFHSLGADPKSDAVVRPRTDDVDIFETASFSSDGHWLIVTADHGWSQNHVWYRDERLKGSPWVPLAVGKDARYTVRSYRDQFYVHTTENAPRGRVLRVDPRNAVREAWVELIPEQTDSTLRTLEIIGGELAIAWVRDVTVHLELRDLHGRSPREIALPAVGTAYGPYGAPSKDEGFFRFMSYTVAPEVHSFSVRSGDSRVWQRPSLPSDSKKFVTEQVFYTSKDGTRVPMFIVR